VRWKATAREISTVRRHVSARGWEFPHYGCQWSACRATISPAAAAVPDPPAHLNARLVLIRRVAAILKQLHMILTTATAVFKLVRGIADEATAAARKTDSSTLHGIG